MKDIYELEQHKAGGFRATGPRVDFTKVRNPEADLYQRLQNNKLTFDRMSGKQKAQYLAMATPMVLLSLANMADLTSVGGAVGHASLSPDSSGPGLSATTHDQVGISANPSGPVALGVDFYERVVDKSPFTGRSFYPDTPKSQVELAQQVMGIDPDVQINGGMSQLWKIAARRIRKEISLNDIKGGTYVRVTSRALPEGREVILEIID